MHVKGEIVVHRDPDLGAYLTLIQAPGTYRRRSANKLQVFHYIESLPLAVVRPVLINKTIFEQRQCLSSRPLKFTSVLIN